MAAKKRPFVTVYPQSPTGPGNPNQWRSAFRARLGIDEATRIVNDSKQTSREILGVGRSADWKMIKDQYRILAKMYHPDRDTGDAAMFRKVQAAYEYLEDAKDRGVLSSTV